MKFHELSAPYQWLTISSLGTAQAARIAFAISPNSGSCERVFSLLESMYGELQDRALADQLRAALMLRYNGRRVG